MSLTETLEAAQKNEVTIYAISTNSAAFFGSKDQERGDKTAQKRRSPGRIGRRAAGPDRGHIFISVGNRIRWIIVFAYSRRVDDTPSVPVRLNDRLVTLRVPLGVVRRANCE